MTSSSPAERAKRSRSPRRARRCPGGRTARPSMRSSTMRWARGREVIPVGADGLIDEAALDEVLAEGPALVAIQQVNNETGVIQPLDRLAPTHSRGRVAAARRLRAERRQAAAARRRLHRRLRPQARRPAGHRRAAGSRPGDARGGRRAGKGLSPRHAGCCPARSLSPRRWRPGPTTWSGWRNCGRGWTKASGSRRHRSSAKTSPRIADDRRRLRCPAHRAPRCWSSSILPGSPSRQEAPARRGDEGQRGPGRDGRRGRDRRRISADQLRARHQRGGRGPLPRRMAADRRRAPQLGRHDLPRLSGDDSGRAGGRRGDAAVDRGEVRQSALALALGTPKRRRRSRSRGARSNARSASTAGVSPSPEARPRRSTGRSRGRSSVRRRAATGSSPSRPSMRRCSTPANGWQGRAST